MAGSRDDEERQTPIETLSDEIGVELLSTLLPDFAGIAKLRLVNRRFNAMATELLSQDKNVLFLLNHLPLDKRGIFIVQFYRKTDRYKEIAARFKEGGYAALMPATLECYLKASPANEGRQILEREFARSPAIMLSMLDRFPIDLVHYFIKQYRTTREYEDLNRSYLVNPFTLTPEQIICHALSTDNISTVYGPFLHGAMETINAENKSKKKSDGSVFSELPFMELFLACTTPDERAHLLATRLPSAHAYLNLNAVDLTDADLRAANLTGVSLEGATLDQAILDNADLRDTNMTNTSLRGTRLTGANLRNCILDRVNLTQALLNEANLEGLSFRNVVLNRTHFDNAKMSRAKLRGASIQGVSFYRANLRWADLSFASCEGVLFEEADLQNANFFEAKLSYSNFNEADLRGACLRRTTFNFTFLYYNTKKMTGIHFFDQILFSRENVSQLMFDVDDCLQRIYDLDSNYNVQISEKIKSELLHVAATDLAKLALESYAKHPERYDDLCDILDKLMLCFRHRRTISAAANAAASFIGQTYLTTSQRILATAKKTLQTLHARQAKKNKGLSSRSP